MNILEKAKAYTDGLRILNEWIGQGEHTVEQSVAQSRADVCLQCPMNADGWHPPEKVALAIKDQVALKNHVSLTVRGEENLKTCSACLCAIPLKIWLPILNITKYSTPDQLREYHPDCWILKETNLN